jgi:hypothetical protein
MIKPISLGIDKKVSDPVRYPKIIIPLENEAKLLFLKGTQEMRIELVKEMGLILDR